MTIRNTGGRSVLDVVTSLLVIAAASMLIYGGMSGAAGGNRTELQVPPGPVSLQGAPIRGSNGADVLMIVYSDFQCPFCGRFTRETLPEIERRYVATGKVAIAFRHLPLPMHPHAVDAAVAAECAGEQGQFWEMHDVLFTFETLNQDTLLTLPDRLDLDRQQFEECRADQRMYERVHASAKEANGLGIRGTPAFFFGRRLDDGRVDVSRALSGARPAADFMKQLDAALAGELPGWRRWFI